jgi:hypothetical protein
MKFTRRLDFMNQESRKTGPASDADLFPADRLLPAFLLS